MVEENESVTTRNVPFKSKGPVCVCVSTCSVKRVVGVEDCREEAQGESADAKRHVKAGVPKTLEHLSSERKQPNQSALKHKRAT